ncbi:MAG: YqzL family protein [Sporolactobacillus sp.]
MADLTWKVFCMTGSIDTYLLMKEIEADRNQLSAETEELEETVPQPTDGC